MDIIQNNSFEVVADQDAIAGNYIQLGTISFCRNKVGEYGSFIVKTFIPWLPQYTYKILSWMPRPPDQAMRSFSLNDWVKLKSSI